MLLSPRITTPRYFLTLYSIDGPGYGSPRIFAKFALEKEYVRLLNDVAYGLSDFPQGTPSFSHFLGIGNVVPIGSESQGALADPVLPKGTTVSYTGAKALFEEVASQGVGDNPNELDVVDLEYITLSRTVPDHKDKHFEVRLAGTSIRRNLMRKGEVLARREVPMGAREAEIVAVAVRYTDIYKSAIRNLIQIRR